MAFGSVLTIREDSKTARKARGAFFTPSPLVEFIAQWAVRDGSERVLEPACGEAEFLLAVLRRFVDLGFSSEDAGSRVKGYELHERTAQEALRRLSSHRMSCSLEVTDFLAKEPLGGYDAVVGNPPYVRFQSVSAAQRIAMRDIARRSGVAMSALSSLLAPFVIQSSLSLNEGGRLGLVLPAELLSVNYAAPIRSFLLDSFASLQLITFDDRVFPEVQEEVVVLLADGYRVGSTEQIKWRQCSDLVDLRSTCLVEYVPDSKDGRWSGLFASGSALESLNGLMDKKALVPLGSWGKVSLGAVTGGNGFFALSPAQAARLGLAKEDLALLCPPGSKHVRRLDMSAARFDDLGRAGVKTRLFYPREGVLSDAVKAYVAKGESEGVHETYKCRKRSPWWRVPLVKAPDILVTYMNAYGPNLCANDVRAIPLNSCHGLYAFPDVRRLACELLPLACLNSATLFGAEIVGRAYGGGMLKLEPREASRLPVPSPSLIDRNKNELRAVKPYADALLARRDFDAVVNLVDAILTVDSEGMGESGFSQMASSCTMMRPRRKRRGGRARDV